MGVTQSRLLLPLLALLTVLSATFVFARPEARTVQQRPGLTDAQRAGGLQFAPGTNPVDEAAVRNVIAKARPEARRLIDAVDGAVTIIIGASGRPDVAGTTQPLPTGYDVTLDLGTISRRFGERGIARLTLHELGHVVDLTLADDATRAALDAATPPSIPCAATDLACQGRSNREERFAESFAKWATADMGVGLEIGYRVPPPTDLAGWGLPLLQRLAT